MAVDPVGQVKTLVKGDQVDGVQRQLAHLVDGEVRRLHLRLVGVEVVQRRGASQRLHALRGPDIDCASNHGSPA